MNDCELRRLVAATWSLLDALGTVVVVPPKRQIPIIDAMEELRKLLPRQGEPLINHELREIFTEEN